MKNPASGDAPLVAVSSDIFRQGQEVEMGRARQYPRGVEAPRRGLEEDQGKLLTEGAVAGRGIVSDGAAPKC